MLGKQLIRPPRISPLSDLTITVTRATIQGSTLQSISDSIDEDE
jgi:hypothetical protein